MKKDSVKDYLSCILFRSFGPLIRSLPLSFALSLGKWLGQLYYYLDFKHKAIAYANIKTAFGDKQGLSGLSRITKDSYRNFGQNIMEIFLIPLINEEYVKKYIVFEGLQHISEGFKREKGVIFLAVHEGSWELSNALCAFLRLPFSLFVRNQKLPRLNALLNSYRSQKGCKIIQRENEIRELIKELKDNSAIGMTVDQGGKDGVLVKFFGKDASMPTGAVKLALKYEAAIIPVFYARIRGPYIKAIIEPIFELKKTGDTDTDVRENLEEIIHIFEKHIRRFPQEYLWSYKIWKYTKEKEILVLSDGKAGHLRQSEALAKIAGSSLGEKGISSHIGAIEIKFKDKFSRCALALSSCLSGKYSCQGCLWCLRTFLQEESYKSLLSVKPDIIISCGSSLAAVNFVLARENLAKSMVILRPSLLAARRFDLVVMPKHDSPPQRKNITVTEGALNLIDDNYLQEQSEMLKQAAGGLLPAADGSIGLLIGGDTKDFHLGKGLMSEVIKQVKSVSEKYKADILVTTSRRTPREIEELVNAEFKGFGRCKLLIIANEKNIPQAVGGILGISSIIITSPESISMISEAATSRKYVLVFKAAGLNRRHKAFLTRLNKARYIYLTEAENLDKAIEDIWLNKPQINALKDNVLVSQAIKKIL